VSATPQLRRLLGLARDLGIAPAAAVVPGRADESLVELASGPECCVWQHGWTHDFHQDGEFGQGRPLDRMIADAVAGQRALDRLFGPAGWQRVFVPPNHQLSLPFKALVPTLGYLGVSAGIPLTPPIDQVAEVNAEIDVMNWPEGTILDAPTIWERLLEQLVSRRAGETPLERPIGILTHHLVFDDRGWELVRGVLDVLKSHPAVETVGADTLFERDVPAARVSVERPLEVRGRAAADVTVVITSCGRQDLLVRTIDSFVRHNTFPVRDFVVVEDGEEEANQALVERYREHHVRWLWTGTRIGQIAAIDFAYASVATEYVFHCEDDWEFLAPGFIEKSLAVLKSNADILQVWLRALADTNNHPIMDAMFFAGEVPYRVLQVGYHSAEWGTWHGFSFNPGLRRTREYRLIGSFSALDPLRQKKSYEVEREASEFYRRHGFLAAILADNEGRGYVKHIGWGRRVPELADDRRGCRAGMQPGGANG
jgi:hypothetical protein